MKCNVGGIDRTGRIVLGIVLLLIGLFIPVGGTLGLVLVVLALIALITGIIRFCPLNAVLGINTCGQAKGEGGK